MSPLTMTITDSQTPALLDLSKIFDDDERVLISLSFSFNVDPCLGHMSYFVDQVSVTLLLVNLKSSNLGMGGNFMIIVIIKFVYGGRTCVPVPNVSRVSCDLCSFSLLSGLRLNHSF